MANWASLWVSDKQTDWITGWLVDVYRLRALTGGVGVEGGRGARGGALVTARKRRMKSDKRSAGQTDRQTDRDRQAHAACGKVMLLGELSSC